MGLFESVLIIGLAVGVIAFILLRRKPQTEPIDKIALKLYELEIAEEQDTRTDVLAMAAPKLLTKPEWFYDPNTPLVIEQTGYFPNQFYAGRQVLRNGTGTIEVRIKNPARFNTLPGGLRYTTFDIIVLAANNGGAVWSAEVIDQAGRVLPVIPKTTIGTVRPENRFSQTFRMGLPVQQVQASSVYVVGELQTSIEHGEYLTVRVTVERKGANYNTSTGYYLTPMFSIGGGWVIP